MLFVNFAKSKKPRLRWFSFYSLSINCLCFRKTLAIHCSVASNPHLKELRDIFALPSTVRAPLPFHPQYALTNFLHNVFVQKVFELVAQPVLRTSAFQVPNSVLKIVAIFSFL